MGSKTQTSTITMKTLSGIFDQPKMHHRRDFLRENKLNLRELQKSTTQKLTQQKEEQEKKQFKHIQKFQKIREHSLARRSDSQNRNVGPGGEGGSGRGRQSRMTAGTDEGGGGDMTKSMAMKAKSNCMPYRRAFSQQRQTTENVPLCTSCCCSHQQQVQNNRRDLQDQEQVPRSVSSVSVASKAESCDKEIQTEDINDEDFLYKALKKCSSSEDQQVCKQKSNDYLQVRDNNLQQHTSSHYSQHCEPETKSLHSRNQVPHINHNNYEGETAHQDYMEQHTVRSQHSHTTNGHYQNYNHEGNADEHDNCLTKDLGQNFQNLKLDDNLRTDVDPQTSARSRQTLCSTSTKRRAKLGCREDLRLPRYLEKEKREKEEEYLREMSRDPNCPTGHYALSEEERLKALHKAEQKMSSLINELNHMPMTTETLRIRNRKQEIEKELQQIEMNIRLYSKSKVYVTEPSPPIQY